MKSSIWKSITEILSGILIAFSVTEWRQIVGNVPYFCFIGILLFCIMFCTVKMIISAKQEN